jgi:hypothetical protein
VPRRCGGIGHRGWEHYTIRLGEVAEGREPGSDLPAS